MAVDLTLITAPGAGSNTWALAPGNDTKDADNLQYCITQSMLRRAPAGATPGVDATINLAAGTFYISKMVVGVDFRGKIKGQGKTLTTLRAGYANGDPLDLLTDAECAQHGSGFMPTLLLCYGLDGGAGTNLKLENLRVFVPNCNREVIYAFFPWYNAHLSQAVWVRGINKQIKAGNLIEVSGTAPNMTVKTRHSFFVNGDVGKKLLIQSWGGANDGSYTITAVASATQATVTMPSGVQTLAINETCGIVPVKYKTGRADFTFDQVTFEAELSATIHPIWGTKISSVDVVAILDDGWQGMFRGPDWTYDDQDPFNPPTPGGTYLAHQNYQGRTYYNSFASCMHNSEGKVTNCDFIKCGLAFIANDNWDNITDPAFVAMHQLPVNKVTSSFEFSHNTVLDCGHTGGFGSAPGIVMVHPPSITTIEHNAYLLTSGTNGGFTGFLQVALGHGHAMLADTLQMNEWEHYEVNTPPTMVIAHNDVEVPNGEFMHILIAGICELNGDPRNHMADLIIAHNKLVGDSAVPIQLEGLDKATIKHNLFQGLGNQDIVLDCVHNVVVENNQWREKPGFHVVIHDKNRGNKVKNELNQAASKVLDESIDTSVEGLPRSTDSTQKPVVVRKDKTKGRGRLQNHVDFDIE